MAALERALALAEVDDAPVRVAEDLDLDVPRLGEVLLEVDAAVPERALGLARRELERGRELLVVARDAHPAPAAAGDGLEEDRVADPARDAHRVLDRVERARAAGDRRARPDSLTVAFATDLSPMRRIASGEGPIHFRPTSSRISAKCAFSARKP